MGGRSLACLLAWLVGLKKGGNGAGVERVADIVRRLGSMLGRRLEKLCWEIRDGLLVCRGGGSFVKPQLGFGGYNLLSMLHTGVSPSKPMVAALRLISWDEEKSVIQLFSFFSFLLALVEDLPGKFLQK